MKPRFREDKATEAAARLLALRGGRMGYMKLIKLLYLADREALARWGRPITFDRYFSLPHGPVLSTVLDLVNEGTPKADSVWERYISPASEYSVALRGPCDLNVLSDAEIALLGEIFERWGRWNRWDLVAKLHEILPEWDDPRGSAMPIAHRDILRATGKTEIEIAQIEAELQEIGEVEALLA